MHECGPVKAHGKKNKKGRLIVSLLLINALNCKLANLKAILCIVYNY